MTAAELEYRRRVEERYQRAMQALLDYEPEPSPEEWTWWDRLVFFLTRRVSRRAFDQRTEAVRREEREMRMLDLELRAASAALERARATP